MSGAELSRTSVARPSEALRASIRIWRISACSSTGLGVRMVLNVYSYLVCR